VRRLGRPAEPAPPPAGATAAPRPETEGWAVRDAVPGAAVDSAGDSGVTVATAGGRSARAADAASLGDRIGALESEIARDEEFMKSRISDPAADPLALADDPEFRSVAQRLPKLQADLRALREERERLEQP
jgi:hypothetical protein